MDLQEEKKILEGTGVPITHPQCYGRIHSALEARLLASVGEMEPIERLFHYEFGELSKLLDLSMLQESCSVRNVIEVREMCNHLIDQEGHLDIKQLHLAVTVLRKRLYRLGPQRGPDGERHAHFLRVLELLQSSPTLKRSINGFRRPFSNAHADSLIRDTLSLPTRVAVSDADTKRAVLSAWLSYLRQNVGSCFATAPAIIVQTEQAERFLKDITDLLGTGQLSRTVHGITYSVPLSSSWGAADLRRPVLLSGHLENSPSPIWFSPGIQSALIAGGLVDGDAQEDEKCAQVKRLLRVAVQRISHGATLFYTNVEDILYQLIQDKHGISSAEMHEYRARPRLMLSAEVAATAEDSLDTGKKIQSFESDLELVSTAFKAITDNALLKAWEFSLASFAETKLELTRWNLYSSLGMRPDDNHGIGERLYAIIKDRVDEANAEAEKEQELYEQVYFQAQHLEGRMRRARDDQQARWLKSEYMTHRNEAHTHVELRDNAQMRAKSLANLYDFLVDQYLDKMRGYFQEVYDADMRDVKAGPYDDSPAGFRLVCKHGRGNTSQWTRIDGPNEFANTLASFFVAIEAEIASDPYMRDLKRDFTYITTNLVTHVKTNSFMETAFERMARAHNAPLVKNPLENLDKVQKKPWVYTSGGTMASLVQCYFGGIEKPTEKEKWVETPDELLAFIIETLRQIPQKQLDLFFDEPHRSLLMHSPTHAFLLRPGLPAVRAAIKSPTYAYTWIKDYVTLDAQIFLRNTRLNNEMIQSLLEALKASIPHDCFDAFSTAFSSIPALMSLTEFREWVLKTVQCTPGLRQGKMQIVREDTIDTLLYEMIPFRPAYQLAENVLSILRRTEGLSDKDLKKLELLVEELLGGIGGQQPISSKHLREICLSVLMLGSLDVASEVDFPLELAHAMQSLQLSMPQPFIFADSNWITHYFAFLVNPGTGDLDLWRVDSTGMKGEPMSHWRMWLDGSQKKPNWGIYTKPQQYR